MAWEYRPFGRTKVRYDDDNDDNPLVYQLFDENVKVTPTSATIETYGPDDSETAILSATAMTVSGTLMSYSIDTTTEANYPVDTGYRARISATYNSIVHVRDVMFDVAKNVYQWNVGRDDLIAEDRRVIGMNWDGDETFKGVIESAQADMQLDVESRVIEGTRLTLGMILDYTKLKKPLVFLTLSKLFRGIDDDQSKEYRQLADTQLAQILATLNFDQNQDLAEDAQLGGLQVLRLEL